RRRASRRSPARTAPRRPPRARCASRRSRHSRRRRRAQATPRSGCARTSPRAARSRPPGRSPGWSSPPARDEGQRGERRGAHPEEHGDPVEELGDRQVGGDVAELLHVAGERHHLPEHQRQHRERGDGAEQIEQLDHGRPRQVIDDVDHQVLVAQEHRRQRDEDGAREAQLDQLERAVDRPVEDGAQRDVGHGEQHHRREEHRGEIAESLLKNQGQTPFFVQLALWENGVCPHFYCQKFFEVFECFSDRAFICLYTARAGSFLSSSSFSFASITWSPILRKRASSCGGSLIGSAPPSTKSFLPMASSASQPSPTSFSTPWVESSTSFLRSAGSFLWKSGFIATPNEDTYEYISVEYFSVPPILKAMPAPP